MSGSPLIALLAVLLWMVFWSMYFRRAWYRLASIRTRWNGRFDGDARQQAYEYEWLLGRTSEIHRLLLGAGVPDGAVPYALPVGFGHVAAGTTSVFENWLVVDETVVGMMNRSFARAGGVYRDRQVQAFNPLWWVSLVLTAPRHVVKWLGGSGDEPATKLLTLIWGLITVVGVVLGILVNAEVLLT